MKKRELIIYDDGFFQNVTLNTLKGENNLILYETFVDNCTHPAKYKITRDDMNLLIKEEKLQIQSMPSVYGEIPMRDKIICIALTKRSDYDVTVYTNDGELALDLLLNGIKVKNEEYDTEFINIGKSKENNEIYIYDTCALIKGMYKIDFSKNYHYFSTCILEELLKKDKQDEMFFKFLYIYNKYSQNVKILNTVSSTQKGGRYSYTDLLLLYSAIRSKNELRNKNITLVTKDRKLFYEAMFLNEFNVVSRFDYFDTVIEENNIGSGNETEEVEVVNLKDDITEDVEDNESMDVDTQLEENEVEDDSIDDEEKIFHIELFQDDEEESDRQNDNNDNKVDSKLSIKEKVRQLTNNHTQILLQKCNKMNILDKPEIIEHVYTSKFRIIPPIPKRKLNNANSDKAYSIHPGYWITFKDNPKVYYRVMSVKKLKATLKKL